MRGAPACRWGRGRLREIVGGGGRGLREGKGRGNRLGRLVSNFRLRIPVGGFALRMCALENPGGVQENESVS